MGRSAGAALWPARASRAPRDAPVGDLLASVVMPTNSVLVAAVFILHGFGLGEEPLLDLSEYVVEPREPI